MYNKEHLNLILEKIRWQIKGMKGWFFIPFLVLCVIQPLYMLLILGVGYGFESVYVYDEITSEVMTLYPPMSLWWSLWLLRKYLEDEERELYYIYEKVKWKEIFLYYSLYMITAAVMLFAYARWLGIGQSCYLFICLAAMCFFYHALAYWFAYASKSATIILIPLLLYTFWVMAPYQYRLGKMNYTNLFYGDYLKGIFCSLLLFIAGFFFVEIGKRENKKYHNYQ